MSSKDEQITSPADGLSADESAVSALLRGLPHIEASKDFDFKLKARIARRKERPGYAGYVRVVAFAAPVLLALIILSVFLFRQPGRGEEVSQQEVPNQETPSSQSPPAASETQAERRTAVAEPGVPAIPVADHSPAMTVPERANRKRDVTPRLGSMGGSFDTAVSPSNTILQRGFGGNTTVKRTDAQATRMIDVGQFLGIIGVSATRDPNGWIVTDVSANSISESSGVQKGDVIESLNDQKLTDAAEIKGQLSVRKMVVNRGGTKIEITLAQH